MKEAIKWTTKYFMKRLEIGDVQNETQELAYRTTIDLLDELEKYRAIGTVETCSEAMEKQNAKKYKILKPCKSANYYQCPVCDGLLHINENFCGNCGQAISWEESEEQQK